VTPQEALCIGAIVDERSFGEIEKVCVGPNMEIKNLGSKVKDLISL
jgi:hypothetical protein